MVKKLKKIKSPIKLDIGCGIKKQEGFLGVDIRKFEGVDIVCDLRKKWSWKENSVEEIFTRSFLEHFSPIDRAHMVNEMYRVLVPGGKVTLILPYGFAERAYGDPTHVWPPIVSFWFYYLNKKWRSTEAPHCNEIYTCDFAVTWGYALHPEFTQKSQEVQQFAASWYVNAIQEIHATMVKE